MEVNNANKSKNLFCLDKVSSALVLFLGMSALFILLFVRDIVGISYTKFLLVGIVGAVGLCLTYSDLIAFIVFLIPMACGMPNNYNFMILTILLILKKGKFNALQVCIPLIVIAQECILALFAMSVSLIKLVAYCVNILMVFFVILDDYDEKVNAKKIVKYFLYGASFTLIMIFLLSVKEHSLGGILTGTHRIGYTKDMTDEMLRFSTNANTIGFYALMCSSVCLYLLSQKRAYKGGYLALFCIDSAIGFFSVSRSYMLFWVLIVAIYFFKTFRLNAKGIAFLISGGLILLFGGYILYAKTDIVAAYLDRFTLDNLSTAGGRSEILSEYFVWLFEHPIRLLFGTGVHDYRQIAGMVHSVHNGTQQILVGYGLVGCVIFGYAFYEAFLKTKEAKKTSNAYLPLVALVLFVQTVQFLAPQEYFMCIIIGFYTLKIQEKSKGKQYGNKN